MTNFMLSIDAINPAMAPWCEEERIVVNVKEPSYEMFSRDELKLGNRIYLCSTSCSSELTAITQLSNPMSPQSKAQSQS